MNASMATLAQAQAWLGAGLLVGDGATAFARVHTDSRTLQPGDLFVALAGERFDAHDFLAQARAQGAACALAQRGIADAGLAGIEVADSLRGLGALARGWRSQFSLPLIAVTGSNGKTTVTQMLAAILRAAHGENTLATAGNFNNDIGVPLTLLRLRAHHARAAVELGMNHPGEIAALAGMAAPTVALVNNAQREHQEFMATVEAVARENAVVFAHLAPGGTAVFPSDDAYSGLWRGLAAPHRCMTFSDDAALPGDVQLSHARWTGDAWQVAATTPAGALHCALGIAGRHNVKNALAATACALAAGVSLAAIVGGLTAFQPVKGRSRAAALVFAGRPLTLVDDSYNANPDSARAAIEMLQGLPGPRLLVLGDMAEVGDQGQAFHAEAGAHARDCGIEHGYFLGAQSAHAARAFGPAARHFDTIDALNDAVRGALPLVASVLVKGSRFMAMERVADAIAATTQPAQQQQQEATHGTPG